MPLWQTNILMRFCCFALMIIWMAGCGTMAKPAATPLERDSAGHSQLGAWTLEYSGDCAGREAERVQVRRLDGSELVFDEFQLRRADDGLFAGNADFIAPMPADGRDVSYRIAYALRRRADGAFAGRETITEDGGAALGCPVTLTYAGHDSR